MPSLLTQKALRNVRKLPFCYLCGKTIAKTDSVNRDHVPPKSIFAPSDRQPLILLSHERCNHSRHLEDEKIGQLISLVRRVAPRDDIQRLRVHWTGVGPALVNLNIEAEVWRWVQAFHAALYGEFLSFAETGKLDQPHMRAVALPFPRANRGSEVIESLRPQHLRIVEMIKSNRMLQNLDQIVGNKGKLVYYSVWDCFEPKLWFCAFALNIYDWKQLGLLRNGRTSGCAGLYVLTSRSKPENASISRRSSIILPNYDPLDPFAP